MKAKFLKEWISNADKLEELIDKELLQRSRDSIETWSFTGTNAHTQILNYLNTVWAFMHTHNGVIYDICDFDNEPGDRATMCGINTGLISKPEFGNDYIFMLFARNNNAWSIEGFRVPGFDKGVNESKLNLQTKVHHLPHRYIKPIPEEILVERLQGYHFYQKKRRTTIRFRNSIIDYANGRLYSKECNWLIRQRIQLIKEDKVSVSAKHQANDKLFHIDCSKLKPIWYASGAEKEKCANPRFDFVYPIFDIENKELDGCLCLNRKKGEGDFQVMKAITLFSPRMAYQDALVLSSHTNLNSPNSWLNKDSVNKSIDNGCKDY